MVYLFFVNHVVHSKFQGGSRASQRHLRRSHPRHRAPDSRRAIEATVRHLGFLPSAVARLADSPQLLEGFQKLTALFDGTTLDPVAREVVVMTVVTRNECHICVAMHSGRLRKLGAEGS